jgi:hypothetical protein
MYSDQQKEIKRRIELKKQHIRLIKLEIQELEGETWKVDNAKNADRRSQSNSRFPATIGR